jgi:hypothetical protein
MSVVSLLVEYFLASSDEVAGEAIDGPGPIAAGLPAIDGRGIEPVVFMGVLEEVLTGVSYDEIATTDPVVADRDGGERLIVGLTETLTDALAAVEADALMTVAGSWSQAEEFGGVAEPSTLAEFLGELVTLARRAVAEGGRLFAWVVV